MSDPENLPLSVPLQRNERVVLDALHTRAPTPDDAAAGHDIRQDLLRAGLDKRAIGVAIQALVDRGLIERFRRDDPDGTFHTAYRLTARAPDGRL